ncbi:MULTISPECIES: winged helix-turn-helix domain-containing protein [Micromonosporaceae]|uniref:winged helix-turn-helix domain-containing protein n=1 Tax=Micromonosporaceae TaxID=28056 RepID=UPI00248AC592|nr:MULTISPECIES: winged helix-turn-helix domain-containing protein [unclassified Solwaraspora]WBB95781.1 winged helix-turn-helix domain-containing protein [Solwaraspora sp. WMMA2059]WBC20315.1 winged helix-turn-helix domain-containing protein [Solwaraspora sp. WMMA2080]WFE21747.1 winged helix-turn-helix domain-containing protein [Solwaraspora sp. WMMD937]WFE30220.1 winged helix-turn-helix domain-containing protein [Solwaraspora sp. WMMD791]WJK37533.1 winged helix-turn-helix domain-containing p
MPKQQYQVLADELRAKIESGEWPPGTKLPSRSQLCREYDVSDTVVGKAMMILRATGLTETLEGVGVFVAEPK